jgi:hypothetical protein
MTTDNRCFVNLFELVEDETGQFIAKQCSRKHKEGSKFCKYMVLWMENAIQR